MISSYWKSCAGNIKIDFYYVAGGASDFQMCRYFFAQKSEKGVVWELRPSKKFGGDGVSRKKGNNTQPDSGPLTQQEIRVNMKTFAAFMARMIEKYGDEVMEEIETERAAKQAADGSAVEEAGS